MSAAIQATPPLSYLLPLNHDYRSFFVAVLNNVQRTEDEAVCEPSENLSVVFSRNGLAGPVLVSRCLLSYSNRSALLDLHRLQEEQPRHKRLQVTGQTSLSKLLQTNAYLSTEGTQDELEQNMLTPLTALAGCLMVDVKARLKYLTDNHERVQVLHQFFAQIIMTPDGRKATKENDLNIVHFSSLQKLEIRNQSQI